MTDSTDSIEKTIGEKVKNIVEKSRVDWPAEWIGKATICVIEEAINHIFTKKIVEVNTIVTGRLVDDCAEDNDDNL